MPKFTYPNGETFTVNSDVLLKAGMSTEEGSPSSSNRDGADHYAYSDEIIQNASSNEIIQIIDIGSFKQPTRLEKMIALLDENKLLQVLVAFPPKIKLPPVKAEWGTGPAMNGETYEAFVLQDGFHRFHASIIYGYTKLPVFHEPIKPTVSSQKESTVSSPKYIPPHLRNKKL